MSRPLKVYKIGYRPPESSLLLVILTLFKQNNVNFFIKHWYSNHILSIVSLLSQPLTDQ